MNKDSNVYDNDEFFKSYSLMERSVYGLESAGEWPQFKQLIPDLKEKNVLDLGCGYGWHCRYAAENGAAEITGIDQSRKMIEEAVRRTNDDRITYRVCELLEYEYPKSSFDLVISNLVLHYIEDLDDIYHKIYETLKDEGIFLFNIEHPVFTSCDKQEWCDCGRWPVSGYFHPGKRKTIFLNHEVEKYHHTLTQIIDGLLKQGFIIEAVQEVAPPEQWRDKMPEEMERPMMLLVRAKKTEILSLT